MDRTRGLLEGWSEKRRGRGRKGREKEKRGEVSGRFGGVVDRADGKMWYMLTPPLFQRLYTKQQRCSTFLEFLFSYILVFAVACVIPFFALYDLDCTTTTISSSSSSSSSSHSTSLYNRFVSLQPILSRICIVVEEHSTVVLLFSIAAVRPSVHPSCTSS